MSQDELAEINGIKPNVLLVDGEEHEVGSTSSKSKYKVKRTLDHYHCTCPAWRNQAGVPVNARTCKHLKAYLGDEYENARIAMKNPDGPPPKGSKAKPKAATTRAKPASKRKRAADESDDAVQDAEKPPPKKASRASKRTKAEAEDVDMTPLAEAVESALNEAPEASGEDELAEINGIKPLVSLRDGEEREVGSATSKSKYKVKRTFDHYYCSCPAWRNQSGVPVNARTCKHLKSFLGEDYETARISLKSSSGTSAGATTKATKAKPASKVKPASKTKPASKAAVKTKLEEKPEDEDVEMEEGREDEEPAKAEDDKPTLNDDAGTDSDELAEIDGIKPNVYMKDGEEREVGSQTSNSKYKVKRTWDHYYCSCPAWRNQGGAPVNARTCKHLKSLLGDAYESARVLKKNPDGPQPKSSNAKTAAKKARGKAKANADGGEDDDEGGTANGKNVPELLLANKWDLDSGPDPTGWWISEKLDGVRTYYDGKQMISRLGNPFTPPQWFLDKLPKDITLDGELFGGRGKFQSTVSIVKTGNSPHWKNITFQVFDIPSRGTEPFESRIAFLQELFGPEGSHHDEQISVVAQELAKDREHVLAKLKEVESLGGEGLMLRKPESLYEGTRSSTLLKIKTFYDAEAIVTGYVDGKGKNKGVTGALQCKMESGKTFNVGSGLSDKQRKNPPAVGSIIVYRFQELTKDRVPRFPTFVGIAADKDKPKDADIPEHKLSTTKTEDT